MIDEVPTAYKTKGGEVGKAVLCRSVEGDVLSGSLPSDLTVITLRLVHKSGLDTV